MLASFKERDFLILWMGNLGSMTAMGMQQVAMGYLAYRLSGSATALGAVTLAWGVPQLIFSLVGGVVADRFPKRNLLITSQSVMFTVALINTILIATGMIQLWHLVMLGLVQGTVFAFNMPARQALVPALVGRDNLANAVALNNAGMNLTRVLGPSLAGYLISVPGIDVAGVYFTMALCYLVALGMLFQIPSSRGGRGQATKGSVSEQLTAGIRYIWGQPKLTVLLVAAFAVVLLGQPYQSLMPIFALKVHNVGSQGLGMLSAAAGIGAFLGSLVVAYISAYPRKEIVQSVAGLVFGVALLCFALAPTFQLALAMMLIVGAAGNMYMALNNTLIMINTEPSMYGRVMSVYMMTFAMMPLSSFPMSVLADAIGAPWTIAGAGVLTALAVAATGVWAQRRRSLAFA
ncbi:MAG: MFS transporter [Chloroflexi bacterium]|nr:MFS transporter [Chloroflexota bacterium]